MSLPFFARQDSWRGLLERWLPRLQRRQVTSATALAYLVLIALAELITTFSDPRVGLTLHGMLLIILLLHTALVSKHAYHRLLLSLTLAPLIRILSLTLPLVGFPLLYWYFVISVPLLVAAALTARTLGLSRVQLGISIRKIPLQFLAMLTGFTFGIAEWYILKPEPLLIAGFTRHSILVSSFILMLCTGFTEEFIFRGVIQRASIQALGRFGLLYVALLFAVLHIGYQSVLDIVFVFIVALLFGWVAEATWSLLGVTLAHGITNIVLFIVMPFLGR
jgi:membrane protease YdiL (CAAX protease family)